MLLQFTPDRWDGNGWASIDIEPADSHLVLPLLQYLATAYGFLLPTIIDLLDGYAADFRIGHSDCTLFLDIWQMSLAFEHDDVRDLVLQHLQSLPADFFPLPPAAS